MNFKAVFEYLLSQFTKQRIDFALIGGFALHAAGHSRTTQDIDLLICVEDIEKVKEILSAFGYELIHESQDVLNFQGRLKNLGRIDVIQAHRQYARKMLQRAKEYDILKSKFSVKVVVPEDLIGLKVQASGNDPARYSQDMADIEIILRNNRGRLDMKQIREYFSLFEREAELDAILERINHAD